ncbi:hypothetical protein [Chromobacterium aquaticum]|uniref:Integrase n=1 Tax=Chromobacterium aquaticum TaxID=467180 RepID=A0ABV8ZMV1_9NEIS|nr:hypothetical protein [Chromobacterium aquaticum]MCD5361264.1 hypothetical protein [Chromobacterium aquaticum]
MTKIPDLKFSMVEYGKNETPLDLLPLLYRGGAGLNVKIVMVEIARGNLGAPLLDRLNLVKRIHEYISERLTAGGSRGTAGTAIRRIREFFTWVDEVNESLNLFSVEQLFIGWTDELILQSKIGSIAEIHAYQSAVAVAKVIKESLQLTYSLLSKTRIRRRKQNRNSLCSLADKQNLEKTFKFGHALLDIKDALSVEAIYGKMPVVIKFRSGQKLEEWLKLRPEETVKTLRETAKPSTRMVALQKRAKWEAEISYRTRHPLINLRLESEMLIFIAQTGINLQQAFTLRLSKFRYQSHLDGYQVFRVYKGRRHGEVAFEIFSEYREHFESYLKWRSAIFPADNEGLLFPFLTAGRANFPPAFSLVRSRARKIGINFVPPTTLRKTRINWLLRRSKDTALTAEMHAHTEETLIRQYEQPSLQVTMAEIGRYHSHTDPAIAAPGVGACVKPVPMAMESIPSEAVFSDCISPAGCFFCIHQRDIDSEDHVWSLASYRHLKLLELSQYRPSAKRAMPHPAKAVIDKITEKLKNFEQSSEVRGLWVREALARIEEESYHPYWEGFIQLVEVRL